jgi:hypothetical protein
MSATTPSTTSSPRLLANRANAQRSTGPRTDAGKAVSSRNATKHGLLARPTLLSDENASELDDFRDDLLTRLASRGVAEELLADDVVGLVWRLRRAGRVEAALFAVGLEAPALRALRDAGSEATALGLTFIDGLAAFSTLSRYEVALAHRLARALTELHRLQSLRGAAVGDDGFVSQSRSTRSGRSPAPSQAPQPVAEMRPISGAYRTRGGGRDAS